MNLTIKTPKWWLYTANILLISSVGIALISLYCWWAINNAKELGPLIAGFYLGFMLYASYGLILLATLAVASGLIHNYPLKPFIITIIISLLPTTFLVVADYF